VFANIVKLRDFSNKYKLNFNFEYFITFARNLVIYGWENLSESLEKISSAWVNMIGNYFSGDLSIYALDLKEILYPGSYFYDIVEKYRDGEGVVTENLVGKGPNLTETMPSMTPLRNSVNVRMKSSRSVRVPMIPEEA
jgi:hypothetical protein